MESNENEAGEAVLEREVAGEYSTFKVYLYLLRVGDASPRQVFQGLGLSSPSLALHHLEKLERLGLASKDAHGRYLGVRRRFGVLRFFVVTGRWLVPRTFFYMVFFLLTAAGAVLLSPPGVREAALILSLFGVVTNLLETIDFYRVLPRASRS